MLRTIEREVLGWKYVPIYSDSTNMTAPAAFILYIQVTPVGRHFADWVSTRVA